MTGYLYDGDCVIAEFDDRGKVRAQYIHGPGLGADVGSLICAQTLGVDGATSERYYSHNWRGDTIGITDESGASLARYRYGAFGELIAGDGGIANDILFSGKRYDSAVGLYCFGARYYDASSGRFVSRDPMGYIDGPNEYVLAMNNPLLWIDPYGLCRGSIFSNQLPIFAVAGTVATETIKNLHPLVKGAALAIGIGSFLYNKRDEISQAVSYGYNSAKNWIETFPSLNTSLPSYEYVPGQVLSTGPMITPGQSTNITDNVYTFPSYTGSTYIESVPAQQRNASDNYLFSSTPKEGNTVYRVWGGSSGPYGQSWTRTDPRTVINYRDYAGLPDTNEGRFLSIGTLTNTEGVSTRKALPYGEYNGGGDEVLIKNSENKIQLKNVIGLNPEF